MTASMSQDDFVVTGLKITKLVVGVLSIDELDTFIEACHQQVDLCGDEAARYGLATAEAVQRFRAAIRELAAPQIAAVANVGGHSHG